MLVSFVIAATLAALFAVGLHLARHSAHSMKCMSNLRQIGIAIRAYGADNGNIIVPTYSSPANPSTYWYHNIAPYLDLPIGLDPLPQGVYTCPLAVEKHPVIKSRTTYSLNTYIAPHQITDPGKVLRYFQATRPAEIIMAAHGAWMAGNSGYASNMDYGGQSPESLHGGKSHILFLDGHVETLPPETYKQTKYWSMH